MGCGGPGGVRFAPLLGSQLVVEARELVDQVVEPLGDLLTPLVQVADLSVLGADALIALGQLRAKRNDLPLRPPVAIDE